MAYERSKFIERLGDRLKPAVEYMCLILYANSLRREAPVGHWLSEVKEISIMLLSDDIKGDNSYRNRKKAILEAFKQVNLLKVKQLHLRNCWKFEEEGFSSNREVFEALQSTVSDIMYMYAEAFAKQDLQLYDSWIQKLSTAKMPINKGDWDK